MIEATTEEQNHPTWKCPVYQIPKMSVPFIRIVDDAMGRFIIIDDKAYEMPRDWIMNRINPITFDTEVYVGPWYQDKTKYAEGYWIEIGMMRMVA